MYAIVKTGGKQYRVERGQSLLVERLPADDGATVALEPLLYVDGSDVLDGDDLAKVKISARVVAHERGPKLRVVKFKPKRGYKRRTGHRQELTRLEVTEIKLGSGRGSSRSSARASASEAPVAAPASEAPAAASASAAAPKAPAAKGRATKAPAGKAPAKTRAKASSSAPASAPDSTASASAPDASAPASAPDASAPPASARANPPESDPPKEGGDGA